MIPQAMVILWALIVLALFGLGVLCYFFLRALIVMVSVVQELRWTAEAYSGRDYEREKKVKKADDPGRVQIEKPWNEDMEAKS